MAQIVFNPGVTWETLPQAQVVRMADKDELIRRLQGMWLEWQEAAGDLKRVTVDMEALYNDLVGLIEAC